MSKLLASILNANAFDYEVSFHQYMGQLYINLTKIEIVYNADDVKGIRKIKGHTQALPLADHMTDDKVGACIDFMVTKLISPKPSF